MSTQTSVHPQHRETGSARAVVTGIGVMAPTGLNTHDFWQAALAGRNGIGRIERFDPSRYAARLAGEIRDFDPASHLPERLLPQTDHVTRLSLAAAEQALADAGVDPAALPEFGMSVVTASSAGGFAFGQNELEKLWAKGSDHVSAYQSFAWFYAVNTGQISIRHGGRGPSGVLVTDSAGGLDAVGQARRHLRGGTALAVTGGVDGSLCPWGWIGQLAEGHLSDRDDPARAYLPFDRDAAGWVPGEGGAILIVEDARAAAARGAHQIYGEVSGYAATFDPPPGSGRRPGLARTIRLALADAGRAPADVDVVFADAAGVPERDRAEVAALAEVFGPHGVPVTAPKAATGRLAAGAGSLDVATALLSLRDGVIPPTPNITSPAYPDLDLVVGTPRETDPHCALVLARGTHGFNAALVLTR
ncbi:actinorhodin polyketide putative beta-ketoacyl synthase 2 [Catellatospora sp. TT07R-123]|uniref:ketosynthase chain-length factor n=1 Tax=Catellatospora sp. TT07R-123 TaxID=2733863 RepID=UPI001B1FADAA|nr:ketosynthase chain-length factor [Catellatospora sp. TT07R-123]GHJ45236.1 actinorhodin polyketide putative beta-ketoacyl synthase 2 [Catellatospora sp. TT07R-123]